jgi:hypothetical protein
MAEVVINGNLNETRWLINDYYKPYIRQSGFDRFMGEGSDAVIRVFRENKTDGGKDIIVPLLGVIKNAGVTDGNVLEGNEVDLEQFADKVTTRWRRNAVKAPKSNTYKSNMDILRLAGPALRDWAARIVLKQGIIDNLNGVVVPGAVGTDGFAATDTVVPYTSATAAQRNAFIVANADRVQFGALVSNASSGIMATALATLDNTDDKMSTAILDLARSRAAETADIASTGPAIQPYMTQDGEEWYVVFVNRRQMRDLRRDSVMMQANREAMERGKDNPLFRNGDLLWNGMIIKEVADLPVIAGAGAGGIDVAQATLVGQSAIAVAWGQSPRLITDNDQDYQFRPAKAIEELIGIKKTSFLGVQYGSYNIYTAAAVNP